MFCKNCGSMIPDGVNFCPACGTPVAAAPEDVTRQAQPEGTGAPEANPFESTQQNAGYAYGGSQSYDPNSYQQPYGSTGGTYTGAPVQSRSIVMCIILSIITCGIYAIYWQIVLVNDFNIVTEEPNETSGGIVFLFSLITCGIYELYWMYKAGNRMDNLKMRLGRERESRGVVYLLLALFGLGIVSFALIQNELNKIAEGTY